MSPRRHCLILLLATAVSACGGGESDEPVPPPVAEPTGCQAGELELADGCKPAGISACAEGFVSDDLGGCLAVLPDTVCGEGTMAVPGETTCREVAPCAEGTWGDIPAAGDTQHVDGAYAGGDSDGSAARPWQTIGQGVTAAAPGAIVALAAGSYAEDVAIKGKPIVLWGRCPALVEIRGSAATVAAVFIQEGANGSAVRDLALTGPRAGLGTTGSLDVVVDRLWIHDTGERGISMEDTFGPTSLMVTGSLIESATGIGAFTLTAALTIERSVVRATQPTSARAGGIGVQTGATLTLRSSLVELNHEDGIFISSSEALIESTVVRHSQPNGELWGSGISIERDNATQTPSSATIRDTLVDGNQTYGILVEGSAAYFERVIVRDTQPQLSDQSLGPGIQVQNHVELAQPSDVTLREVVLERNHYAGASITGSTALIESTIVRDTVPPPALHDHGRGIVVFLDEATQMAASATVLGSVIERNAEAGVFGQGVELTIDRTAILHTNPRASDGVGGRGICVQSVSSDQPSILTVRDSLLDGNTNSAAYIDGSFATIERTVFRNTAQDQSDGLLGDAVVAINYHDFSIGSTTLIDSTLEASNRAGVASFGAQVAIGGTVFECNAIDMNGQNLGPSPYGFEDRSGNQCGCSGGEHTCQVLASELAPPGPMGP
jgi:hypothetical protein